MNLGRWSGAGVALLAFAAASCSIGVAPSPTVRSAAPEALTVFAAASLTNAFADVKTTYEASHPGLTLRLSFGASSTLEAQLEQGAPADVFASADTANPQKLADAGLGAGHVLPFARNRLAIIVPVASAVAIRSPADLVRPGLKIVAAGESVPITRYADQLVENLGRQPGYPSGFAAAVRANVVSRQDNVAAVVSTIALGEGDAGIVYVTDAKGSNQVSTVAIPDAANVTATYGAVALKSSKQAPAAAAFLRWLAGPGGQAVLARFGFLPAG